MPQASDIAEIVFNQARRNTLIPTSLPTIDSGLEILTSLGYIPRDEKGNLSHRDLSHTEADARPVGDGIFFRKVRSDGINPITEIDLYCIDNKWDEAQLAQYRSLLVKLFDSLLSSNVDFAVYGNPHGDPLYLHKVEP